MSEIAHTKKSAYAQRQSTSASWHPADLDHLYALSQAIAAIYRRLLVRIFAIRIALAFVNEIVTRGRLGSRVQ
jgi:hypothetical protein